MDIGEEYAGHGERRAAALDRAHSKDDEKGPPTIGLSFPKMTTLTLRAPVQIKEPQPSTGMTAPTTRPVQ